MSAPPILALAFATLFLPPASFLIRSFQSLTQFEPLWTSHFDETWSLLRARLEDLEDDNIWLEQSGQLSWYYSYTPSSPDNFSRPVQDGFEFVLML
ncbi:hypothetical protein J7T55_002219 [Diaporthe amygdali]|uniref:uncharacterized protein n=1 Tax=Phomopsis amygdali TaxID=1214568 RepID=UPI0022FEEF08|nr:uncharacterized protein J7T55_002219 [Diaporthe amygdali]KAJ0109027.1 hypothetical protein J7T55_002219 [Diaporthe amygdali]